MFTTAFSSKVSRPGAHGVADGYATCADFCEVFKDNVDRLYMLSLLLTGAHEMAERCLLRAFEHCLGAKTVFTEWAPSWAKRITIKTAIEIVFGSQIPPSNHFKSEFVVERVAGVDALVAVVSSLEPFDRIVYVLSVLEGFPVRECALLLDCTVHEVMHAKTRALRSTSNLPRQKHPNHGRGSLEKSAATTFID